MMGDVFEEGLENESPVHNVRMDGFYLGRFPVTQAQWERLMPYNPSRFNGRDRPVEQVTWESVEQFITRLSEANQGRYGFHLPTEAQWEYAARSGGELQRYAGGNQVAAVAWCDETSDGKTHPVGQKAPNHLGLYDMSGNVLEWCQDTYGADAYKEHTSENPFHAEEGRERVIRGGSWSLDAWSARCTRRGGFPMDYLGPGLGFRLVLVNAA